MKTALSFIYNLAQFSQISFQNFSHISTKPDHQTLKNLYGLKQSAKFEKQGEVINETHCSFHIYLLIYEKPISGFFDKLNSFRDDLLIVL